MKVSVKSNRKSPYLLASLDGCEEMQGHRMGIENIHLHQMHTHRRLIFFLYAVIHLEGTGLHLLQASKSLKIGNDADNRHLALSWWIQ